MRPLERFGRKVRVQLEVGDLCQCVDAGIGPSRSVKLEFLPSGDLADGAIDLSLDRSGVLLDLPAAVACPGVFDEELEPRHPRLVFAVQRAHNLRGYPSRREAKHLHADLVHQAGYHERPPGHHRVVAGARHVG